MEQLTSFQLKVLEKLADGDTKLYCMITGMGGIITEIPTWNAEAWAEDFKGLKRLIELKLVADVSSRFPKITKDAEEDGNEAIIVNLLKRGQWMFERVGA